MHNSYGKESTVASEDQTVSQKGLDIFEAQKCPDLAFEIRLRSHLRSARP